MSYFGVVTASNPVLYWTLQETSSSGPLWVCSDYGKYGYLTGTVSASDRNYNVNLTATMPNLDPWTSTPPTYQPNQLPLWGSPAGQNPSGCLAMSASGYAGPQTGPFTGSNQTVLPELTATFQLSSSWTIEWWQQCSVNQSMMTMQFIGRSGSATVGWKFGWTYVYYQWAEIYWISGSTGSGSPPATYGEKHWYTYNSAIPWPWPYSAAVGQRNVHHFVVIWNGSGTLSGAANNKPNMDVWVDGVKRDWVAGTWTGTEPPTGSQLWWTQSSFRIGSKNPSTDGPTGIHAINHVSIYDRALSSNEIIDRATSFLGQAFSGSVSGLSGSGSFNQASGSYMINSVQRPTRNLVAPESGSTGGMDPMSSKINPGTN
jgi:hypothetical protein